MSTFYPGFSSSTTSTLMICELKTKTHQSEHRHLGYFKKKRSIKSFILLLALKKRSTSYKIKWSLVWCGSTLTPQEMASVCRRWAKNLATLRSLFVSRRWIVSNCSRKMFWYGSTYFLSSWQNRCQVERTLKQF